MFVFQHHSYFSFIFFSLFRNIKSVIRNKIEDMKRNNIAEKFIKDVERQLHLDLSVK